ncbi:MAG: FAD-dependent thymidylate synthase [Proteobacteria bacterium]|nr:FAD-dependent thymidylate synthase [Pseudomonadota bacterium]
MALAAGTDGCCIALEPNPYVFKVMEINAGLNRDKTNIVALGCAATDSDGTFTFQYSDAAFCNGGYLSKIESKRHGNRFELEVQGRNLEALLRRDYAERLDRLSYVKIDTEGYDRHVIQSLMDVLFEFRPVVRTEVFKNLTLEERRGLFGLLREDSERAYAHYQEMLNENAAGGALDENRQGLARELARMNLSLGFYTQWYWKTNLHNLLHFLSLRADAHAQYEIRVYAKAMLDTLKRWAPLTYGAFMDYRMGGIGLSAKGLAVVKRLIAGEQVSQEDSGLPKREYRELMTDLEREG